jgi:alpha-tubulin suppressor-like RCC1 family protein
VQRSIPLNNLNDSERICGLTPAQQIYCWIRGGGATSPALIESPILFNAVAVGGVTRTGPGGNYTACALDTDGNAYCWGFGALGDGNAARTVEQTTPVAVAGGLKFKEISIGDYHTCALTLDGTAYCWQGNTSGETGTGPGAPLDSLLLVPTAVNTSLKFTRISAGWARTCAVATDRAAYCWGYDHGFTPETPVPTQVPGAYHFTSISTGFYVTCGLTVEGPEVCWGANSLGFMGNGYLEGGRSTPTPIAGQRVFAN